MLTAKQDNRLTAAENTLDALRLDPTPYAQDKALQNIVLDLAQFVTDLKPMRQEGLRTKSKGSSQTKTNQRAFLATVAAEIAGDTYSYATSKQDRLLQATIDYSQSNLEDLRDTALFDRAEHILTTATAHASFLLDYGVTPARLQELREAIDAFSGGKNVPGQQISAGKNARLAIRARFSDLTTLSKDRLDRSLRKYARSHPDFYQRVTQARQVIDRPGTHKSSNDETPKS